MGQLRGRRPHEVEALLGREDGQRGGRDLLGRPLVLLRQLGHPRGRSFARRTLQGSQQGGPDGGAVLRGDLRVGGGLDLADVRLKDALPGLEAADLRGRHQRDGLALAARAPGPADPVSVDLRAPGDVEVDDVRDVRHVDAAGGDVGGHEQLQLLGAQPSEDPLPEDLAQIAVQGVHREPLSGELLGDLGAGLTGPGEDQGRAPGLGLEDPDQRLQLVALGNAEPALVDVIDLGTASAAVGFDGDGVAQRGRRDPPDLRGHRRGEHRDLPLAGGRGHQLLDVLQEALAQHLVGFVHDEHLDLGEVQATRVQDVEEATGGADDDGHAGPQRLELGPVRRTSVDGGDPDAVVAAELSELLSDLQGELAGRGEDEPPKPRPAVAQAIEEGQAERRGLPGAGPGSGDEVAAAEEDRDRGGLDGRRRLESEPCEGDEDAGVQAEGVEGGNGFVGVAGRLHAAGNALISTTCQ